MAYILIVFMVIEFWNIFRSFGQYIQRTNSGENLGYSSIIGIVIDFVLSELLYLPLFFIPVKITNIAELIIVASLIYFYRYLFVSFVSALVNYLIERIHYKRNYLRKDNHNGK